MYKEINETYIRPYSSISNTRIVVLDHSMMFKFHDQYTEKPLTDSKSDRWYNQVLGETTQMKFIEFIQTNFDELDIPFQSELKKQYPDDVWKVLHKTLIVHDLQHYKRAEVIRSLISEVNDGNSLAGLTIDNVISMWLEFMMSVAYHVIDDARTNNFKIRAKYDSLATEKEVICSDSHNEIEENLVSKGVEIPEHTHVVKYIEVTDENRDQFNEFVDAILRYFDSDTYGELPEEYSTAGTRDIDAIVTELEEAIGDKTEVARYLRSLDDNFGSDDFI